MATLRRLAGVARHLTAVAPTATTTTTADVAAAPPRFGKNSLVEMDPDLSVTAGHSPEELLR